jgi:YjbE family integral membrane protein
MDFALDWGALGALGALASVIVIDLVLSGDNAIVVGMAAAALPPHRRARVIGIGIAVATVLRVLLALVAVRLLAIVGLTLAGGILLLWVAWKFYRDMRQYRAGGAHYLSPVARRQAMGSAVLRIVLADLSMSLENVLAIAGSARNHPWVMAGGLVLSVALMGAAATLLARLMERWRWLAWLGLAIIAFVALRMIYDGSVQVIDTTLR